MADKSTKSTAIEGDEPQSSDTTEDSSVQLAQLRDIVFGAAKHSLERRLDNLETTMQNEFALIRDNQAANLAMLQKTIQETTQQLTNKLNDLDKSHQHKSDEINAYADRIASELEMAETTSKEDNDQLHDRLDKEVRALTQNFNEQFAQAMRKLEQVTQDLTSSKTDRKTLAKLLATVAVNLETDDDNE